MCVNILHTMDLIGLAAVSEYVPSITGDRLA
jgi:hypothetical protein